MSLRDDLIAAKALIDTPEKWRQDGSFGFGTGCFCILGAICTIRPNPDEHFRDVRGAVAAQVPLGQHTVSFNDDPATTHADVMALFDRAIQAASPTPSIDMSKQGAKQ